VTRRRLRLRRILNLRSRKGGGRSVLSLMTGEVGATNALPLVIFLWSNSKFAFTPWIIFVYTHNDLTKL
jgi:hypothetical protein